MIMPAARLTQAYDLTWLYQDTISSDTNTDSAAFDTQDYEGPIHIVGFVGAYGDGDTQTIVKLRQDDASGGSYEDVSGVTTTLAASATANDNSDIFLCSDSYSKRYLKVRAVTSGGGTPSVQLAIGILARRKRAGGSGIKTDG